jgi:hypothetical protein
MKTNLLKTLREDACKHIRLEVTNTCEIYKREYVSWGRYVKKFLRYNSGNTVSFEFEMGFPGWQTQNLEEALDMLEIQRRLYIEQQVQYFKEKYRL